MTFKIKNSFYVLCFLTISLSGCQPSGGGGGSSPGSSSTSNADPSALTGGVTPSPSNNPQQPVASTNNPTNIDSDKPVNITPAAPVNTPSPDPDPTNAAANAGKTTTDSTQTAEIASTDPTPATGPTDAAGTATVDNNTTAEIATTDPTPATDATTVDSKPAEPVVLAPTDKDGDILYYFYTSNNNVVSWHRYNQTQNLMHANLGSVNIDNEMQIKRIIFNQQKSKVFLIGNSTKIHSYLIDPVNKSLNTEQTLDISNNCGEKNCKATQINQLVLGPNGKKAYITTDAETFTVDVNSDGSLGTPSLTDKFPSSVTDKYGTTYPSCTYIFSLFPHSNEALASRECHTLDTVNDKQFTKLFHYNINNDDELLESKYTFWVSIDYNPYLSEFNFYEGHYYTNQDANADMHGQYFSLKTPFLFDRNSFYMFNNQKSFLYSCAKTQNETQTKIIRCSSPSIYSVPNPPRDTYSRTMAFGDYNKGIYKIDHNSSNTYQAQIDFLRNVDTHQNSYILYTSPYYEYQISKFLGVEPKGNLFYNFYLYRYSNNTTTYLKLEIYDITTSTISVRYPSYNDTNVIQVNGDVAVLWDEYDYRNEEPPAAATPSETTP